MSLTVDGVWKANVWASTVWADGVWFEGARQIGGGGGGPLDMGEESPPFKPILYIEEPEDRFRSHREKHALLREQIRVALEGPQAERVREALESQPVDSARPLHERVVLEDLTPHIIAIVEEQYREALRARQRIEAERIARERDIEDDDEEVSLLL